MSSNNFDQERRKQRALERFGTNHPICAGCGWDDWRGLELHHIAGKDSDPTTVILCGNCHAGMTDAQKDYPPRGQVADPFLDQVGRFLLGLAELLKLAVEKLFEFGLELIARARTTAHDGEAV